MRLESWLLRRFSSVITLSGQMRERLIAKGVAANRIGLVRNWVDLTKIKPLAEPNVFRAELGLSGVDFRHSLCRQHRRQTGARRGAGRGFVSYTSSDRDWAFWIGHELEDVGHRPHIHEWELSRRRRYYGLDGDATDAADHVLCVVSEKYLKASYSSWERNSAQWDVVTGPPSLERFQIPRNQQAARIFVLSHVLNANRYPLRLKML